MGHVTIPWLAPAMDFHYRWVMVAGAWSCSTREMEKILPAGIEHHLDTGNALYDYNNHRQAVLPTHPHLDNENYAA